MIVPTLRVVTHPVTLCVTTSRADAERPRRHSHAERGNNQKLEVARERGVPVLVLKRPELAQVDRELLSPDETLIALANFIR